MTDPSIKLAIEGGPPAITSGPFPWPLESDAVRESLEEAYASGDWGRYHGQRCDRLKESLQRLLGVAHSQLTCSGTIAVELALRAVGVKAADRVVLAGYDFPGNFRAIEAVGARPVLVDIDADGWRIDADAIEQASADGRTHGVTAVVVSHLHGTHAPMRRLTRLADRFGWKIVEDACQSPGAVVDGRPAGSWGAAGVLSFGGSKPLTAGRGGAVVTDDPTIAQRAKVFAGRGNDAYALSELQAAVLLPQVTALTDQNKKRSVAAARLSEQTAGIPGLHTPASPPAPDIAVYYKRGWRLSDARLRSARPELIRALQAEGLAIDAGFQGFTVRSQRRCDRLGDLPQSQQASKDTLLLHHPILLAAPHSIQQAALAMRKVFRCLDGSESATASRRS